MSKGGSQKAQTVTNQTTLPQFVTDASTDLLQRAGDVADRPFEQYGGQTVAGLTPDQQAAFDYARANLGVGANTINAATDRISGDNLTTTAQGLLNPYLANVEDAAVGQVQRSGDIAQNNLAAKAAQSGAFGGSRFGVEAGVLSGETARQAGDLSNQIRAQGWDKAVSTALGQAQAVTQGATAGQVAGLQSAAALQSAGTAEQQQQQADLNALLKQWQDARDYPLEQLAIRQQALASVPYGTTTTSSQQLNQPSSALSGLAGGLSGAASGAALGSAFPVIGTGVGAGVGGLLGLLGGLSK